MKIKCFLNLLAVLKVGNGKLERARMCFKTNGREDFVFLNEDDS